MKTLLRDETGAAFAEALISLPVLAIALVGVVAIHGMYGASIDAKSEARRLAWLQADAGHCPESTCRSARCEQSAVGIQSSGLEAVETSQGGLSTASFLQDLGRRLLVGSTTGIGRATAPRPGLLGGGRVEQRAGFPLICNTTARTSTDGTNVLEHACANGLSDVDFASELCR